MNPITMSLIVDDQLRAALREDITNEDLSTMCVCPAARPAEVQLIAKQQGVIAGLDVFERVFALLDPATSVERLVEDGDEVESGQLLAWVRGDARVLLSGERVALNYLQRLSGVATCTRRMARVLEGTGTVIADTRKTTPGMRVLEREAVALGGGVNHRFNLSSAIMLKDNHIDAAGGVREAIEAARAYASFTCKVEVEVEDLQMAREAVDAGADIIMLDNMGREEMERAIQIIDRRAIVEASGNVDLDRVRELADLGVDVISSGALTHSAGILDLSLKHLRMLDGDEAAR